MRTDGSLKNRGLIPFGPADAPSPRTLIVLGAARGGTSIVAGALAKLGVFMGSRANPPVFEDLHLAKPIESGDWTLVERIVGEYGRDHPVWGFKRPRVAECLDQLHPMLEAPFYLVVFRDLAAIANRNAISMRAPALASMELALTQYAKILGFLSSGSVQGLMLSSEKILLHSDHFIDHLVEHTGMAARVSREQLAAAKAFITLDPPEYLEKSRLTFRGHLDRLTGELVSGWACISGQQEPVVLHVAVGLRRVGQVTATLQRNDVRDQGFHPNGQCGFRFVFPAGSEPRPGDVVSVQFAIGGDHLTGSPRALK